eukprot:Gb_35097 [translate_table: standard]
MPPRGQFFGLDKENGKSEVEKEIMEGEVQQQQHKEENEEKGKVSVTGGAGYVASWLIMRLLQQGYRVKATVRSDPKYKEETSHLLNLPWAKERLEIIDADLCVEGSFDAAVDGCIGVFHVATPTNFDVQDPENEVIKPAVNGTFSILKACVKSKTVRRMVYTSSAGAVAWSGTKLEEIDESIWTSVDFCRKEKMPGWVSIFCFQDFSRERSIGLCRKNKFDLVTLLPAVVVGPFLIDTLPPSMTTALALILGNKEHYKLLKQMQFVHIDDVASAQIFLLETPAAKGRYICSSHDTTIHQLAQMLAVRYPEFNIPTKEYALAPPLLWTLKHKCHLTWFEEYGEEKALHMSSKKLQSLGYEFKYSLEDMFDGAIHCCKQKALL